MPTARPSSWLRAMRPKQWIKNILVAAAPAAAGVLDDGSMLARTIIALLVFTVASAVVYLINDAADVHVDRLHPRKKRRPIAAGEITVPDARRAAALLGTSSVIVAALLSWSFFLVVVSYLALNVVYSAGMKHVPYAELAIVASGFVLRAVGGGTAVDIPLSVWFLLVVCAGSAFVVVGKRGAELARTGGANARSVLQHYSPGVLLAIRAISAGVAVVAYALWVVQTEETVGWLAVLSFALLAAAFFWYSRAIDTGHGEDPEDVFLRDRMFQLTSLAWLVVYTGAVYG